MDVVGDVCKMIKKIKDYIEKWKDSKVYSYQVGSPNIVFLIAVFFIVLVAVDYIYSAGRLVLFFKDTIPSRFQLHDKVFITTSYKIR